MSVLQEQHARWAEARGRLDTSQYPPLPSSVTVVRRKVLSDSAIAIREQRQRFDQAMRDTLAMGLSARVGAHFATEDEELEEVLKAAVPTWRRIATEVAEKHHVKLIDLFSNRRHAKSCAARHEAFWRCRNETTMSLPLIGRKFGGRDHTTVLHGVRKHEERMRSANAN